MGSRTLLRLAFWLALAGFVAWDLERAPPINQRLEPPLVVAGSGQAVAGGHCSAAR